MTFTPREFAGACFRTVVSMGQGRVRGADMAEVTAARIATCDRAVGVIERAIGTERILLREPDDAMLRRWLQQVQDRRDALQPVTT